MQNNKLIGIILIVVAFLAVYFTWKYFKDESAAQAKKELEMEKIMSPNANPNAADPHRPSDKGPYGKFKTKTYDNEKKALERSVNKIESNDEDDAPAGDPEEP